MLCREFSHSCDGAERSLAQTQQVPLDPFSSLPTWTMQVKADLSALLLRKRVPSSQKGGRKVKMFHAHILPASALRSPGSVSVHSASVALSLHSCPLTLRGHGERVG